MPVQIVDRSDRVQAALKFAAGASAAGSLSAGLCYLCEQLAAMTASPVASVYVLEAGDELVLRGTFGFTRDALGEVRMKVGQGITGTCVETMSPVTVNDARLTEQFEYFPQLAEERYPAFLAIPLLSATRPRGALVLQREAGPFSESDILLTISATRALTALIESQNPAGAHVILRGEGNHRGRSLGVATLLSRALPRRDPRKTSPGQLSAAFASEREEIMQLAERARATAAASCRELEEICTTLTDVRLEERAQEHVARYVPPSIALERIAAEVARALAQHGPAARRAVDIEAFLGAIARRLSGIEAQRVRRGELVVSVHLPGLVALRSWAAGATGAVCATPRDDSTGGAVLTALGMPVVWGVRDIFESVSQGDRVALDSESGEVIVNPSAAQAAAWRR
ncbi:MAG: GAF domain-containing protein [Deltaproteobacteria bacterium]|nr:MAG: GAF domain-containing protein [Deltaproteobacteria bacterium]